MFTLKFAFLVTTIAIFCMSFSVTPVLASNNYSHTRLLNNVLEKKDTQLSVAHFLECRHLYALKRTSKSTAELLRASIVHQVCGDAIHVIMQSLAGFLVIPNIPNTCEGPMSIWPDLKIAILMLKSFPLPKSTNHFALAPLGLMSNMKLMPLLTCTVKRPHLKLVLQDILAMIEIPTIQRKEICNYKYLFQFDNGNVRHHDLVRVEDVLPEGFCNGF